MYIKRDLKKKLVVYVTATILLVTLYMPLNADDASIGVYSSVSSSPITIDGNAEADTYFTSDPGDGLSWGTAYTIEDLEIDGSDSSACIDLRNTNRFIVISGCTFTDGADPIGDAAVYLSNVTNLRILNCDFLSNEYSIYAEKSDGINITSNTLSNTTNYESCSGIYLYRANNTIIDNNELSMTGDEAIALIDSGDCIVKNNIITGSSYGILLDNCTNALIDSNSMYNTGLSFDWNVLFDATSMTVTSNTVNGKALIWIESQNDVQPAAYVNPGQLFLIGCTNSEISGLSINHTSTGLGLIGCTNINVSSSFFKDNWYCIQIQESTNIIVESSNFGEPSKFNDWSSRGVFLYDTITAKVSKCDFRYNTFGVDITTGSLVTVENSNFTLNNYGIEVGGSGNLIQDNIVISNWFAGIELSGDDGSDVLRNLIKDNNDEGIKSRFTDNAEIYDNLIYDNPTGISGQDMDSSWIKNNSICASDYAITLDTGSAYNDLWMNCLVGKVDNAVDDGTDNDWDNGTHGNIWYEYEDDYAAATNDGEFWSESYQVSGTASASDNFPLVNVSCSCPCGSQSSDPDPDPDPDPNTDPTVPGFNVAVLFLISSLGIIAMMKSCKIKKQE